MLPKGLKNYTQFATNFLNIGLTPPPPPLNKVKKTVELVRDGTTMRKIFQIQNENTHYKISLRCDTVIYIVHNSLKGDLDTHSLSHRVTH